MEHVYILRTRESSNLKENVYKIGKTKQEIHRRFSSYGKDIEVYLVRSVDNCHVTETKIKELFDVKYERVETYGREYYKGDIKDMIKVLNELCDTCVPNQEEKFDETSSEEDEELSTVFIHTKKYLNSIYDKPEKIDGYIEFYSDSNVPSFVSIEEIEKIHKIGKRYIKPVQDVILKYFELTKNPETGVSWKILKMFLEKEKGYKPFSCEMEIISMVIAKLSDYKVPTHNYSSTKVNNYDWYDVVRCLSPKPNLLRPLDKLALDRYKDFKSIQESFRFTILGSLLSKYKQDTVCDGENCTGEICDGKNCKYERICKVYKYLIENFYSLNENAYNSGSIYRIIKEKVQGTGFYFYRDEVYYACFMTGCGISTSSEDTFGINLWLIPKFSP